MTSAVQQHQTCAGEEFLTRNQRFARYSHPITSSYNCSISLRCIHSSTGHTLHKLAPRTSDRNWLGLSSWSSSRSSIGCGAAWFVLILLVVIIVIVIVYSRLSDGLGVLLVLVDSPVEHIVILERFADEQVTEDLAEI